MRDPRTRDYLLEVFQGPTIWANAPFDLSVIAEEYDLHDEVFDLLERGEAFDVLIGAALIDIRNGKHRHYGRYDLKTVALRFGKMELSKDDDIRLTYGPLRDVPLKQWSKRHTDYALEDSIGTEAAFYGMAEYNDAFAPMAWEMRADMALYLMSRHGMRIDQAAVQRYSEKTDALIADMREELKRRGFLRSNGSKNMKAIREYAEAHGAYERTDTGLISLSADALAGCEDPLLRRYAEYEHALKLESTYFSKLRGRFAARPRYDVLMKTGRTSCSNPPIQQLPREEGPRECFIPRDGNAIISVDGSVAELVSFAQTLIDLVGESNLATILREGRDPHMELAKTFTDEPTSEDRRRAKPVSFGLPGRMGARGLAEYARKSYGVDMSVDEAYTAIAQWHSLDPSFQKYFDWLKSLEVHGLISLELPWSGMLCGDLFPTQAANILFQGRTAHAFKRALWRLTKRQYADDFRLIAFLHDEILAEAPLDKVHEVGQIISGEIVQAYREVCPDVPLRAEPAAMMRWSKKAEPKYENGRLVPWDAK